jgi:hypothetical protein
MRNTLIKIPGIALFLLTALCFNSLAQSESPARIEFDIHSKRIDIVTGKALPDYKQAERGSFQFFFGRLDSPDDFFWYYWDGRSSQKIENVALMRKMLPQSVWAVVRNGKPDSSGKIIVKTNPINIVAIQHHAISFVPLNPSTKKPEPRVYVLLEDMNLIQFSPVDHWIASMGQKEYESEKGRNY